MSIYLNFPNELHAQDALAEYTPSEYKGVPPYIGHVACHVLGMVADSPTTVFDGWVIVLSESIPALSQYEFIPTFPIQSFAEGPGPKVKRIPQEIARWQAKMALILFKDADGVDMWTKVLVLRETVTDPVLQISMDAALYDVQSWRRNSPTVNMVAESLGLSEEEVDEMFINASKLVL